MTLTVKVDSYTARQPFVVVRKLGADALLGCTFIDKHVKSVRPRMKFIELEDGTRFTIRRRPQMVPSHRSTAETSRVPAAPPPSSKVRVARRPVVPAGTEVALQVTCGATETRVLAPAPHLYMKKRVSMANGLVDIRPLEPFCVMVTKFSSSDVTLAKHEVVALALQAPRNGIPGQCRPSPTSRSET